jgi:hypothetical protein
MGSLRPEQSSGLFPDQYWALKSRWRNCADIVLAGDSRVLIGLSPVEMNKTLKNKRIYNYGFGDTWFSGKYLEAVENVLDHNSNDKTIILAITPHSLTKRYDNTGNFFEKLGLSEQEKFMHIHFGRIMHFFEPLSFKEALEGLIPAMADSHTIRKYYRDGWISVHKEPAEETRESKRYRGFYTERTVSSENISLLMQYIAEWKSRDIKVFGLLFPTCKPMYELENQLSGFNEKEFISQFERAGGKWIYVNQTACTSFDGSHLQQESAERFSNDFTELLYKVWNDQPSRLTKKLTSDNCDLVNSRKL